MAWKRVVVEMGMGTSIRSGDYTQAAVRALRDALWRSSLSVTRALGMDVDAMRVEILVGVPQPEAVDTSKILEILPHGLNIENLSYGATYDIGYCDNSSNNSFASWRSAVSNPSVNHAYTGSSKS